MYRSSNPKATGIKESVSSVINLNTLEPSISESLESEVCMSEFDYVVKNLKNNKSPGWDGLTAEFYKHFWSVIKPVLYNSYLESIKCHCLSPSQRIGILTLLPKPKSPTELNYIKNWRPITLLNIDYKLFTHVIKNRINKALPYIISEVQTGFQAGRSTSENLILTCLVLEHFNNNAEEEGIILQVDFEKAFDTVEHSFLFETLKTMGFGNYLINLIKVAFFGCFSYANINGYLSAPIYFARGLHQGSPLSPILFLLIAQVFSSRLEQSHEIAGLTINGIDILLSLFADDTDIFLQATKECVDAVITELQQFGVYSGCKANVSKTTCIPLGKTKENSVLLDYLTNKFGDDFVKSSFSALGINFNNTDSIAEITNTNFVEKLDKAKNWVDLWSKRDLTFFGKITIIKSLIYSQFTYLILPLSRPSITLIKNIDTLTFHFLWGCKRDKIRREVVTRPKQQGGLGIILFNDFMQSQKLTLLNKLFKQKFSHAWKRIIIAQLKYPDHINISVENGLLRNNNFEFAEDLLNCYKGVNSRSVELGYTNNACIWDNADITGLWGRVLWNNILINKNVIYISDFLDDTMNDSIISYEYFCEKYDISCLDFPRDKYSIIKMAIRDYRVHTVKVSDYTSFIENTALSHIVSGLNNNKPIKGKQIRDIWLHFNDPNFLTPLKMWSEDLNACNIDWTLVFINLHFDNCKNFKLIQFQYKLLMRITTCKYMRFKMGIVSDSPMCSLCNSELETLPHIFLKCSHTISFLGRLRSFILLKIDPHFRDSKRIHYITCGHNNNLINYLNTAAKWYISKQFQKGIPLIWEGFIKFIRLALHGEKKSISDNLIKII